MIDRKEKELIDKFLDWKWAELQAESKQTEFRIGAYFIDPREYDYKRQNAVFNRLPRIDLIVWNRNQFFLYEAKIKINRDDISFKAIGQILGAKYLLNKDHNKAKYAGEWFDCKNIDRTYWDMLRHPMEGEPVLGLICTQIDDFFLHFCQANGIHVYEYDSDRWHHYEPWTEEELKTHLPEMMQSHPMKEIPFEFDPERKFKEREIEPDHLLIAGDEFHDVHEDAIFMINELVTLKENGIPTEFRKFTKEEAKLFWENNIKPNSRLIAKNSMESAKATYKTGSGNMSLGNSISLMDANGMVIAGASLFFINFIWEMGETRDEVRQYLSGEMEDDHDDKQDNSELTLSKDYIALHEQNNRLKKEECSRLLFDKRKTDLFVKKENRIVEFKKEINWDVIGQLQVYSWWYSLFQPTDTLPVKKRAVYYHKEQYGSAHLIEEVAKDYKIECMFRKEVDGDKIGFYTYQ